MMRAPRTLRPWEAELTRRALAALLVCGACIIPDRDIRLEVEEPDNPSAVRIVEPAPLAPQMREICNRPRPRTADDPRPDTTFCPQVESQPIRSGLLRPERGAFCICPPGLRDANALPRFEIYAEDGDLRSANSSGALYGVFLLDLDFDANAPEAAVAYQSYWRPERQPLPVDAPAASVGREEVTHWAFRVGSTSRRVDLCNDNDGKPLEPGLHDLQFMVTDRPWFTPQELDDDGNPLMIDGKPVYGNPQYGVPDLAVGATYDTVTFVFECQEHDPEDTEDAACDCREDVP